MKSIALLLMMSWWLSAVAGERSVTMDEVEKHQTTDDCWVIIDKKVYNLTDVLATHRSRCKEVNLSDYCGKDATHVWNDKEKSSKPHKKISHLIMSKDFMGTLTP